MRKIVIAILRRPNVLTIAEKSRESRLIDELLRTGPAALLRPGLAEFPAHYDRRGFSFDHYPIEWVSGAHPIDGRRSICRKIDRFRRRIPRSST
jgi:hypothetical protein